MGTSGLSHLRQKSIKSVVFETPRSVDLDLLNGNPRIWIGSSDFGGSYLLFTLQFITNRPKQKSPKFPIKGFGCVSALKIACRVYKVSKGGCLTLLGCSGFVLHLGC